MSITRAVENVLRLFVGTPGHYTHEAEVLAEDLAYDTDFTEAEAVVAAGDIVGLDDKDIQQRLAMGGHSVSKIRTQLRQRYREAGDSDGPIQDWAESRV